MDTPRQKLSRPRAADGFTPAFDQKTEAYMDRHSPLRNPELVQRSLARSRALRGEVEPDGE